MSKKLKLRNRISFLLVVVMVLYTFLPCISYAQSVPSYTPPPNTKNLTYYYHGSVLMDSEDDNGLMSSYLGKNVRTIIDTSSQSIVQTNSLISDGKNVIAQTDDTGTNINNTQQYTPYGVPTPSLNTLNLKPKTSADILNILQNPYQYDNYYYDTESGLYYLNARYYSPILMQFISMDTYDLANKYAYCNGDPISNEDPTGHISTGVSLGLDILGIITSTIGVMASPFTGGSSIVAGLSITSAIMGSVSASTAVASTLELMEKNQKKADSLSIASTITGLASLAFGLLASWKSAREAAQLANFHNGNWPGGGGGGDGDGCFCCNDNDNDNDKNYVPKYNDYKQKDKVSCGLYAMKNYLKNEGVDSYTYDVLVRPNVKGTNQTLSKEELFDRYDNDIIKDLLPTKRYSFSASSGDVVVSYGKGINYKDIIDSSIKKNGQFNALVFDSVREHWTNVSATDSDNIILYDSLPGKGKPATGELISSDYLKGKGVLIKPLFE